MYDKYLEIFALSDVFSDYVKYLREKMQFGTRGTVTYLMRRWFYAFPELSYSDWLEILKIYDRDYNPNPPKTSLSVPLHECCQLDRILRNKLEKSIAHWQDDTDPIWHNLYNSRNVEKGV